MLVTDPKSFPVLPARDSTSSTIPVIALATLSWLLRSRAFFLAMIRFWHILALP
jgi:hypothetical protein